MFNSINNIFSGFYNVNDNSVYRYEPKVFHESKKLFFGDHLEKLHQIFACHSANISDYDDLANISDTLLSQLPAGLAKIDLQELDDLGVENFFLATFATLDLESESYYATGDFYVEEQAIAAKMAFLAEELLHSQCAPLQVFGFFLLCRCGVVQQVPDYIGILTGQLCHLLNIQSDCEVRHALLEQFLYYGSKIDPADPLFFGWDHFKPSNLSIGDNFAEERVISALMDKNCSEAELLEALLLCFAVSRRPEVIKFVVDGYVQMAQFYAIEDFEELGRQLSMSYLASPKEASAASEIFQIFLQHPQLNPQEYRLSIVEELIDQNDFFAAYDFLTSFQQTFPFYKFRYAAQLCSVMLEVVLDEKLHASSYEHLKWAIHLLFDQYKLFTRHLMVKKLQPIVQKICLTAASKPSLSLLAANLLSMYQLPNAEFWNEAFTSLRPFSPAWVEAIESLCNRIKPFSGEDEVVLGCWIKLIQAVVTHKSRFLNEGLMLLHSVEKDQNLLGKLESYPCLRELKLQVCSQHFEEGQEKSGFRLWNKYQAGLTELLPYPWDKSANLREIIELLHLGPCLKIYREDVCRMANRIARYLLNMPQKDLSAQLQDLIKSRQEWLLRALRQDLEGEDIISELEMFLIKNFNSSKTHLNRC